MRIWDKLDRGPVVTLYGVTPACLKQASRMGVVFNFLCVFIFGGLDDL